MHFPWISNGIPIGFQMILLRFLMILIRKTKFQKPKSQEPESQEPKSQEPKSPRSQEPKSQEPKCQEQRNRHGLIRDS